VATMVPMVGVIVLTLGLLGAFHSIHKGTPSAARSRSEGSCDAGGMTFLWLRAARQDQPGVRRARSMRSPPAWRRSAGSHCCSPAPVDALQICTIAPAEADGNSARICYATNP
jgi:hypothetical protein